MTDSWITKRAIQSTTKHTGPELCLVFVGTAEQPLIICIGVEDAAYLGLPVTASLTWPMKCHNFGW